MIGWVRVCTTAELLPGEYRVAWDGDTPIAVFNVDGELYAIEDVCTHDGGELTGGIIEGPKLQGEVLPGGGDWLLVGSDGTGRVDVRATIRTWSGCSPTSSCNSRYIACSGVSP